MSTESITLYYHEGSSDKIYETSILEKDGGFVVNFAYGRRGSMLKTGTKTNAPVSFIVAKKIFDKLVNEKKAKGYTPGANGTPYSGTENAQRSTGVLPQLLNPIDEAQAELLIEGSTHWLQQKFDGQRVIIDAGDEITGVNRKGLTIALPVSIVNSTAKIGLPCILDGEAIGETFHAFDLLSRDGKDYRACSYRARYEALVRLIGDGIDSIKLAATFTLTPDKRREFVRLKCANAEGVVFKSPNAVYTAGRPASGGPQLKFKFYASGSFIVAGANRSKRSVGLEALNDLGKSVFVGNVTIPTNHKIPVVGTIIEVRYLYCFPEGCLFQPCYLGVRNDIDRNDCTTAQLKYKPADDDGE